LGSYEELEDELLDHPKQTMPDVIPNDMKSIQILKLEDRSGEVVWRAVL
jgi:hypothetical protein